MEKEGGKVFDRLIGEGRGDDTPEFAMHLTLGGKDTLIICAYRRVKNPAATARCALN
jgi:hypothetical protein